jgi:pimeloyl-ACP methyl ester carboxylesterase
VLLWQQDVAGAFEWQIFGARGVNIHYQVSAVGEPVVLIHRLHSSGRINWQLPGTVASLAADHQVFALDLPGFASRTSRLVQTRMATMD